MEKLRRVELEGRLRKRFKNTDIDIDFLIQRVIAYFLNFTSLSEVPKEADILIYDMAVRMMVEEGVLGDNSKDVKQIKRGDTTITYADDSSVKPYFNDFTSRLIHFRTLNIPKDY